MLESVLFTRTVRRTFFDVSFLIFRSKVRVIMGRSRIRKTALLRLIGGQFQCANGR
mgnify:CR=1 FL=1